MLKDELTFIVFTTLRPDCLRGLLHSLRKYYPDVPVAIADDSPIPYPEVAEEYSGITYRTFPDNLGSGMCYNHLIDNEVKTPFVALLDDDYIFTPQTRIEKLLNFCQMGIADFVGGGVHIRSNNLLTNYVGNLWIEERDKGRVLMFGRLDNLKPTTCDIMPNFWVTRTDTLRSIRWDERLKLCRHQDFFLRVIGYTPESGTEREQKNICFYDPSVIVSHCHNQIPPAYHEKRNVHFADFKPIFMNKWSLVDCENCQI